MLCHAHLQAAALGGPVPDGAALEAPLAARALAPLQVVRALARLLHEAGQQEDNHHVGNICVELHDGSLPTTCMHLGASRHVA